VIWVISGALALAALFGLPAVPTARRAAAERRAAARAQREEDRRRREEEKQRRLEEAQRIWRDTPDLGVLREYERYEAHVRTPRQQEADETGRQLSAVNAAVTRHEGTFRGSKRPGVAYQGGLLVALLGFLSVLALGVALDYLIFRSLRPSGLDNALVSAALASLAMVGISVGSAVAIGAERHHLLPDGMTEYARRVTRLAGAMLAIGLVAFVAAIAPYRSQLTWQPTIAADQQAVQQATFNVGTAPDVQTKHRYETTLQDAKAQLSADRESLSRASNVDRGSALVLGVVEVFLAEGAILGGEVLALRILLARQERTREANQAALDAVAQGDTQFVAQLTAQLTAHGHDQDAVRAGLARVRELSRILGTGVSPETAEARGTGTGDMEAASAPGAAGGDSGPRGGTPQAPASPPTFIPPRTNEAPQPPPPSPYVVPGSVVNGAPADATRLPDAEFDETA
jgi:hypothetical protein